MNWTNGSTSATDLEHNDLVAIFPNCTKTADSTGSGCDPTHLMRVIRFDTTSLQANMGIELEIAKIQENPSDERNNVVQFLSSTVSASEKYPGLSMNGKTIGYVYDGDYDGVPYIMDPNDDDPNQPGSGGGPGGGPAGDVGMMQGTFGGQGVSLMLRNKYGYATSGSTKLDGDDWDNKSPSRSVMIVLDGFWPDEIESFKVSNSDLSMSDMQVFTCSKAIFDAYGGFSSAATCSADNSTASGVTISNGMVSESKMVFSLGLGTSLFKSGKALDITSSAKKSKFKYNLKFRSKQICRQSICMWIHSMSGDASDERRGQDTFPKADDTNKDYGVGPFEGVKVDDGTEVDVREVSKLDSQKDITISASKVTNATEYTLHVFCAGTETSTMYEPPFQWEMRLPNAAKAPEWKIPRNTIWGGRSCDFRLIAFGEDSVGNPIGSTIYKFTDTLKGGGGMGGPMMDLNVMINSSNLAVCYDNSSKFRYFREQLFRSTNYGHLVDDNFRKTHFDWRLVKQRLNQVPKELVGEGDIDASSGNQAISFQRRNQYYPYLWKYIKRRFLF